MDTNVRNVTVCRTTKSVRLVLRVYLNANEIVRYSNKNYQYFAKIL